MNRSDITDAVSVYRKCRRSLVAFRSLLLDNPTKFEYEPAPFHNTWSEILLYGTDNYAIEAFRESAKSQYLMRAFPLHALTFPSELSDYFVIVKQNTTQANDKLVDIEREFLESPALTYRLEKINEQNAHAFDVTVEDDDLVKRRVRIESYGKHEAIRGIVKRAVRPKLILADDLQDTKESRSEKILEDDWKWFLSDIMFLSQHARVFLIGNNLGEKCIIERVAASAEAFGFKFERIPKLNPDNTPTWPSKYTFEAVMKEKEAFRVAGQLPIWLREAMCVSVSDETRLFKKEDFRYFLPGMRDKILADSNLYMTIDPAASVEDTADYRALVVAAISSDNRWFIPDVSYGRYNPSELIDEIFRLVVLYKLQEVGIEEGVLKAQLDHYLKKEMQRRNIYFTIRPLKARARKEERIRLLQPRFKAQTIYFEADAPWLAEMEAELLAFTMEGTRGLHDDVIDALAYMEQIAVPPHRGKQEISQLPRRANMS